jgi:hypothetical protein
MYFFLLNLMGVMGALNVEEGTRSDLVAILPMKTQQ